MASWRPQNPFEEELVSMQPDYNFVYGDLTDDQKRGYFARPRVHLDFLNNQLSKSNAAKNVSGSQEESNERHSLHVIREVHKIAGTKEMGAQASLEDWDSRDNAEAETIAMIRHFGMGPSIDQPLNTKMTIPTLPIQDKVRVMYNGQRTMPVIFDDDFFKMESTRMRYASIEAQLNGSKKVDEKFEIKPLPAEEEEFETKDEFHKRQQQEFLIAYPSLGESKLNEIGKPFSSTENSGSSSNTSYSSVLCDQKFELSNDNSCSSFLTANESFVSDPTNNLCTSYSETLQQSNEKSEANLTNIKAGKHKRFYTPKEIYNLKHS